MASRKLYEGFARANLLASAAAIGMLVFSAGSAKAVVLAPGGSGTPNGSFNLNNDVLIPADSETTAFDNSDVGSHHLIFDFQLTSQVYQNTVTGGLDFTYQLTNLAPASNSHSDSFESIDVSSFATFGVDADYQANSGLAGGSPADVSSSEVDRSGDGVDVNYVLSSALDPGNVTDLLIVRTNATSVIQGNADVIDSFQGNVDAQVPFGAVAPEPTSMGLMAISMGLLARRRRNASK